MAKFIQLKDDLWINPDNIAYIQKDDDHVRITTLNDDELYLEASLEEVMSTLNPNVEKKQSGKPTMNVIKEDDSVILKDYKELLNYHTFEIVYKRDDHHEYLCTCCNREFILVVDAKRHVETQMVYRSALERKELRQLYHQTDGIVIKGLSKEETKELIAKEKRESPIDWEKYMDEFEEKWNKGKNNE